MATQHRMSLCPSATGPLLPLERRANCPHGGWDELGSADEGGVSRCGLNCPVLSSQGDWDWGSIPNE